MSGLIKKFLSAGVGDNQRVSVCEAVSMIFTKFLMFICIDDVWDVPFSVDGGDIPCVPIKQCR